MYFTVLDSKTEMIIDPIGQCEEVVLQNCLHGKCLSGEQVFTGELVATEMVPRNGWVDAYYDDILYNDLTGEPLGVPRFIEVTPDTLRALV